MSKLILLTQGKTAIVDDDRFEEVNKFKWYYCKRYAVRDVHVNGKKTSVYMHRLIANAPDELEVDHINGDGTDNRKENLRLCTHAENSRNRRMQSNNTSGYKGVWFQESTGHFVAETRLNGKKISLGSYRTAEEASAVYAAKVTEIHGRFANIVNDVASKNPLRELTKDIVPERNNDPRSNTGYFSVNESGYGNRFYATITYKKELVKIGSFLSLHEAVRAYNAKAIELYGDKANLNVVKEGEKDVIFKSKLKQSFTIQGLKGVYYTKNRDKYKAVFKAKHIGTFDTLKEAASAYNQVATEFYGEYAELNTVSFQ